MITVFMKHAKNFISKDNARPLFQTIMFTGTHAMATNTQICAVIPFNSDRQNIDYRTGKIIEGESPNWQKYIPDECIGHIRIDHEIVARWADEFKIALKVSDKSAYNIFSFKDNVIKTNFFEHEFTCTLPIVSKRGEIDSNFSIEYFLKTMEFFKDLQADKVTIDFYGKLKPAVVKGNGAIVIISPAFVREKDE